MSGIRARLHIRRGEERGVGGPLHSLPELKHADVVSLIETELERRAELLLGKVTLRPGGDIPLHRHSHSETIFVLDGCVIVQRDGGIVELKAPGAAYFPAGAVHAIRSLRGQEATFLICYPRSAISRALQTMLTGPNADTTSWPNPNVIPEENRAYRWAVREDFESAVPVEPSKGRDLTVRYLLDPERGAPDLAAGTGEQEPNIHYTMHRHEPPELYYVLQGRGTIYVGDESYEVQEGSAVYVPSLVPHGIDTFDSPLRIYWAYGLDRCGPDWTWEAVEAIYNHPRR